MFLTVKFINLSDSTVFVDLLVSYQSKSENIRQKFIVVVVNIGFSKGLFRFEE